VELLAEEGNFRGAQRLETLWNELAERCSFTLLCGYCAAHFVTPGAGAALQEICRSHSRSRPMPRIRSVHGSLPRTDRARRFFPLY
jgi:hypothetical protein